MCEQPFDETVGVIGLGYVGLPLALRLSDVGYDVIGVDLDENRINSLNTGESYISDIPDRAVDSHLGSFRPTTNYADLTEAKAISICVPTPLSKSEQPDTSYVTDAAERLADVVQPGGTIVLESTIYPGGTKEIVAGTLERKGFKVGEDIFVANSPERLNPGNESIPLAEIPKVIGGVTPSCGDRAEAFYDPAFETLVRVERAREAEFTKHLENVFRSVNIGLINELAIVANALDVDIWRVVDAAATKPFGFMSFYPGPGVGGHCIPVDPMYLSWQANKLGVDTTLIDQAHAINQRMADYVVERVRELLNEKMDPSEADILVIGAAYKGDVADTRRSPAISVIKQLDAFAHTVSYHDPHVPMLHVDDTTYHSRELTTDEVSDVDCAVIVTEHSDIDVELLVRNSSLLFDSRNATTGFEASHVHRL